MGHGLDILLASFPVGIRNVHKHMVGNVVPCIVDADEKQQQNCASHGKQRIVYARRSRECRHRKYGVRDEGQR